MFCGVYSVCIVYGVFGLGFGGVHSVSTVYEAFRLVVFCAFTSLVVFTGRWGRTFVAFLQCL